MGMHFKLLLVFVIVAACSQGLQDDFIGYEEHTVERYSVFLDTEQNDFIGNPTGILADDEGLYFTDSGFGRISKVDSSGDSLYSFGSYGRGPGEVDNFSNFWKLDDEYLVYDYNSFKFVRFGADGEMLEEILMEKNPANPDGTPNQIPVTAYAISSHEVLIPARGKNGSLFALADLKSDHVEFAGNAESDFVKRFDPMAVQESFLAGEIPAIFKNAALLSGTSSGIYSYKQTTGLLEKHSHELNTEWSQTFIIPSQEDLFEQISKGNQDNTSGESAFRMFQYIHSIEAHEEGVAMLLNMPEGYDLTVAWITKDGQQADVVTFEGLNYESMGHLFRDSFTLSPTRKKVYFLNSEYGKVYKADWPL